MEILELLKALEQHMRNKLECGPEQNLHECSMNQALRKHHMAIKYLMSEAVSVARYTFQWYIAHLQSIPIGYDFIETRECFH